MVHRQERADLIRSQVEARHVQRSVGGQTADGGVLGGNEPLDAIDDPLQHAAVFAKARPDELAPLVLAEPVDEVDARQLGRIAVAADLQPVRIVVAHVVAAEGQHRERVAAQLAHLVLRRRRAFGGDVGGEEHPVLPVKRFGHQRHRRRAAPAEQDGRDRHALRIFPLRRDDRALARRHGEARIGVRRRIARRRRPLPAAPVGQTGGGRVGQAFPPDVAVFGEGHVREDAV